MLDRSLAQPEGKIHQRNDLGTQIEGTEHGRILNFRQAGDLGHLNDFQHLGHVDAIIAPIGLAAFAWLIEKKLDDFQFVRAGFQQNIRLRHVASARYSLRTRTAAFQQR